MNGIGNKVKRNFLRNLYSEVEIRDNKARIFLSHLCDGNLILEKVHFVEDGAKYCGVGVEIGCGGKDKFSVYFNASLYDEFNSIDKLLDIINERNHDVYIQLNFSSRRVRAEILSSLVTVLEDNPFIPDSRRPENAHSKIAERVLELSLINHRLKTILKEIDCALDYGKQQKFKKLSEEYNELLNRKNKLIELETNDITN